MKSSLSKVMHPVAGLPMVRHVLATSESLGASRVVVVVAPTMDDVRAAVAPFPCAVQSEALGTGHAVKAAQDALADFDGLVIVLYGDTPLVRTESLQRMIERQRETQADIVVSGFEPDQAGSYGRLVTDEQGDLLKIVEAADASEAEKEIRLCNGGMMLFKSDKLWSLLAGLKNENAKGEYYLTDCIEAVNNAGGKAVVSLMPTEDVMGVNTRVQLAEAEAVMQCRLRERAMLSGVTMTDPASVFLSVDTRFGRDVTVGPNVVFGAGVTVGDRVDIKPFCHIEQAEIEADAQIGPYARLRPGAKIGAQAHIGNFVEIKKSEVARGAKVNHLSYIGDAMVGEKTNIGAGTITCNYDGYHKFRTEIGAGVFVGSNTALVAPVKIGDGALIAAGSTITKDIEPDGMGVARGKQMNLDGAAKKYRDTRSK